MSPPPSPDERVFLGIGANLAPEGYPDPRAGCLAAIDQLGGAGTGVRVVAVSPWYRTAPVPASDQPWYQNAVVEVATALEPAELMAVLHELERGFGRVRGPRNEARALDIDIVDFRGMAQAGPPELPHPRMHSRGFVLLPLRDLAPDWRHPATNTPIADLIAALDPAETVERDD